MLWRKERVSMTQALQEAQRSQGKNRCRHVLSVVVASLLGGVLSTSLVPANPVFHFSSGSGLTALQGSNPTLANTVIADFRTAGNRWSSIFSDNVTLNIAIDFKPLGAGILGETSSNYAVTTYAATRTALNVDKKTTDDSTAVKNLPASNTLSFLTNSSSGQVILENNGSANNLYLAMPTANAKALGLGTPTATAQDASMTFSSAFKFDFDPTNGILAGQYDFVGVATHEIGHSLGFVHTPCSARSTCSGIVHQASSTSLTAGPRISRPTVESHTSVHFRRVPSMVMVVRPAIGRTTLDWGSWTPHGRLAS